MIGELRSGRIHCRLEFNYRQRRICQNLTRFDKTIHCLTYGAAYGIRCLGGIVFQEDARWVPLSRFDLHRGERFRYEYDFTADWTLDIRLEKALPFNQDRALPLCIGGSRAAPPEDCAGAWDYLERLDRHKYRLPIEELGIMAEAMHRFLDSDGDRHAIGDLDELREAVDRVRAYQDFRPAKFDRRKLNAQLRAIKWYLWHGNVFQALRHLKFVAMDLESATFESQEEDMHGLATAKS